MMFRSKTFAQRTTNGTNLVCTEPAGAATNDILLMQFTVFVGGGAISAPAGWSVAYSHNGSDMATCVWWIRRGGSAPALTPSWASSQSYAEAIVSAYSGCITSGTPYDDVQGNPQSAPNPCNPDPPAATSAGTGRIAVAMGFGWQGDSGSGWTVPSGYSARETNSGGGGQALALADLAVGSGSINPGAYSGGAASAGNADGITLLLAPEPSGGSSILRQMMAHH